MTPPSAPYELQQTLLEVKGVSLTLGGMPILRDVNFEIKNIHRPGLQQGQVVGLLGPSGMGKTCLFHILAGLQQPDEGSVLVEGGKPVQRGMVGVVAQHYPLFTHRTVISNMLVAGQNAGLSTDAARAKAIDLLKRFGMESHLNKYPVQLSGGQRQRVAIAQQFMCSEHYILMDEPFSGLDPIAVQRVSDFISQMAATDELETFILVTHDIQAAVEVCDTLLLLGHEYDAQGNPIPGARIQKTFNLIERGLAWRECIADTPECQQLVREVREAFLKL